MVPNPSGGEPAAASGISQGGKAHGAAPISDEVFHKIVERVYALLLADLRIEDERRRMSGRQGLNTK